MRTAFYFSSITISENYCFVGLLCVQECMIFHIDFLVFKHYFHKKSCHYKKTGSSFSNFRKCVIITGVLTVTSSSGWRSFELTLNSSGNVFENLKSRIILLLKLMASLLIDPTHVPEVLLVILKTCITRLICLSRRTFYLRWLFVSLKSAGL
jgi:hypothetical protein